VANRGKPIADPNGRRAARESHAPAADGPRRETAY